MVLFASHFGRRSTITGLQKRILSVLVREKLALRAKSRERLRCMQRLRFTVTSTMNICTTCISACSLPHAAGHFSYLTDVGPTSIVQNVPPTSCEMLFSNRTLARSLISSETNREQVQTVDRILLIFFVKKSNRTYPLLYQQTR